MKASTYSSLDFMKIRHYIFDKISSHGGEPVVFPSTRKLAEMFNVSQPTALRAIRDLITDGYLTPLKSGGTISVKQDIPDWRCSKIFGALLASGDLAFFHRYFLWLFSEIGLELTYRSKSYLLQNLLLESPSLLESTVKNFNMSGLLLVSPKDYFAQPALSLKQQGIAVVGLMADFPGISCADVDYRQLCKRLLLRLFREGRRHIVFTKHPYALNTDHIQAGIADACREANIPVEQVILLADYPQENYDRLKELIGFGLKPDAVVFLMMNQLICELLAEKLDIHEECRLVGHDDILSKDIPFTGEIFRFNIGGAVKALVDNLLAQLESDAPVIRENIDVELYSCQDGNLTERLQL